jgi:enamine deaminase RidA (YjgF/YER057c/UK114 family)
LQCPLLAHSGHLFARVGRKADIRQICRAYYDCFMPRQLISSGSPFEKFVGYSRAVIDGDFAFIAGTTGYDYTSMTMPAEVTAQTRNCFTTIEKVLSDAGFAMADIVRAVYYITDPKNADAVLAVCGETLGDIRPAATLLVVAGLYKPEMLVEIEVTAKRRS